MKLVHHEPGRLEAEPACAALARAAGAADDGVDTRVGEFELDGLRIRVVAVSGVVPRQLQSRRTDRARLVYADDELGHFSCGGRLYALVPVRSPADRDTREDGADPEQIRLLLTNRELQIVQLVCMGLLTKQIADRLHLSEFTVRSYLKTIYCKLGVRSRGAMVYRYARALAKWPD